MGDPAAQTGYWGRWRASDLTGADGSTVESWTAVTGQVLSQATAGARPVLATDANGRRLVRFDGVDDRLFSEALVYLNDRPGSTMYVAARLRTVSATGTHNIIFSSTGASAGNARHLLRMSSAKISIGGRRLDGDTFAGSAPASPTINLDQLYVFTSGAEYSAARIAGWVDGTVHTDQAFQTAGNTSATNPLNVSLGAATTTGFFDGDLYEVVLYDAFHTAAERSAVHSYFQDTYGIAVSDYVPPLPDTPRNLRNTGATSTSLSDAWDAAANAASYEVEYVRVEPVSAFVGWGIPL